MDEFREKSLKRDAEVIFLAGVAAVEPRRAVLEHLSLEGDILTVGDHTIPLEGEGAVHVIGAGKAGGPMAAAVEEVLGDRLSGGLVVVKDGHLHPTRKVRLLEASHPIPDRRGMEAAGEVAGILGSAGKEDLVICVISGGGSALLPLPVPGVSLEDLEETTGALLASGCPIHEINAIRKHLSRLKGGRLAQLAHPARVVSLILSDVPGDDLDAIASGPTVPDPTTFADCLATVDRYDLKGKIPARVLRHLEEGFRGEHPETPKPEDAKAWRVVNLLVGNNRRAVRAAAGKAESLGYRTLILSSAMEGEAREIALAHTAIAREILSGGAPLKPPACVISGGEPTVTLRGKGVGGRNTEFALAASLDMAGLEGVVILSAGTDGTDGFTEAAGAFAESATISRAREAGMDPSDRLDDNDSYTVFKRLDDLLVTGPTGTNVMDLRVVLVAPRAR